MAKPFDIVILGLSITSSWGNGHAAIWRSLVKGLQARGHRVLFLEREQTWFTTHRDRSGEPCCDVRLYRNMRELRRQHTAAVDAADVVIVGSHVPDGIDVCRWVLSTARGVCAFYDIDTPVTLARLRKGNCSYLEANLVPAFDLYLSFAAGLALDLLRTEFRARYAAPLFCSVDVDEYRPLDCSPTTDLGYMGTYSEDRQAKLDLLLLAAANRLSDRRFMVAGAQYPADIVWPANVDHVEQVQQGEHLKFYASQRFSLSLARADMAACGFSPTPRLLEAAACGVPIICDEWPGITEMFEPDEEILVARNTDDVIAALQSLPEGRRIAIGAAARERVLAAHSGAQRAAELEMHVENARSRSQARASSG